jgi:hypothetical protein
MDRFDIALISGAVSIAVAIIGGLMGLSAYETRVIGASADPIAAACALGHSRGACVIFAARR